MINIKRNDRIRKEYLSGKYTLKELADKYSITFQRIFEIVKREKKYCEEHKKYYYSNCVFCTKNKKYDSFLKNKLDSKIMKEIEICSAKGNDPKLSIRRKKLIKVLVNKYNLSFVKIGVLLKRHHTSIVYNYYE